MPKIDEFFKNSKKWPEFDVKIGKFYFSRNRAVGCIFLYPEMGSLGSEEAKSTSKTPWYAQNLKSLQLAYVNSKKVMKRNIYLKLLQKVPNNVISKYFT